jgi:hypothetical protein
MNYLTEYQHLANDKVTVKLKVGVGFWHNISKHQKAFKQNCTTFVTGVFVCVCVYIKHDSLSHKTMRECYCKNHPYNCNIVLFNMKSEECQTSRS